MFGIGPFMRDMDRDFDHMMGAHARTMNQMNQMMNSMFGGSSFGGLGGMGMGMLGPGMGMRHGHGQGMMPYGSPSMSPFGQMGLGGFPDFNEMLQSQGGAGHSFSSMSVTQVSSGPDGRPQVYQASNQTAVAPGGVREVRKTVADSRSGTKKLSVGRHVGERGHIREREENVYTGQREENEEFVNLHETEAPHFDREWRQRAYGGGHSTSMPAITEPDYHHHPRVGTRRHREIEYQPRPSASTPSVTIEELPPSDDEQEQLSCPPPTVGGTSSNTHSRRSPYMREKKSKSKRAKKN